MKQIMNSVLCGLIFATFALAQEPRLARGLSAMNAGSYLPAGLPGAGVAPGARMVVIGSNLTTGDLQEQPTAESLSFGGVSAQITLGGATREVYVLLVAKTRIEVLLPADAPTGEGTLSLNVNGTALSAPFTVVASAPGIRTRGSLGSGLAFLLDSSANEVSPGRPAVRGETYRIRTTGLGAESEMSQAQILVGSLAVPIGGLTRLPNGYDDLTFELPAGVEPGCAVPVAVRSRGVISNFAAIPVGTTAGSPCVDRALPTDINPDLLLQNGARIGSINLTRTDISLAGIKVQSDAGSGGFYRYETQSVADGTAFAGSFQTIGACTVFRSFQIPDLPEVTITSQFLDAGDKITVNGPNGAKDLTKEGVGLYAGRFGERFVIDSPIPLPSTPLYLDPGTYTIAGTGGADVGAFTTQLRIGANVTWTNAESFGTACGTSRCINRTQDLKLDWTGGDDRRTVNVTGFAAPGRVPQGAPTFTVFFFCQERADRGTLTVPSAVLSALPESATEGSLLTFSVNSEPALFQASGLDWGSVVFTQAIARSATYR